MINDMAIGGGRGQVVKKGAMGLPSGGGGGGTRATSDGLLVWLGAAVCRLCEGIWEHENLVLKPGGMRITECSMVYGFAVKIK